VRTVWPEARSSARALGPRLGTEAVERLECTAQAFGRFRASSEAPEPLAVREFSPAMVERRRYPRVQNQSVPERFFKNGIGCDDAAASSSRCASRDSACRYGLRFERVEDRGRTRCIVGANVRFDQVRGRVDDPRFADLTVTENALDWLERNDRLRGIAASQLEQADSGVCISRRHQQTGCGVGREGLSRVEEALLVASERCLDTCDSCAGVAPLRRYSRLLEQRNRLVRVGQCRHPPPDAEVELGECVQRLRQVAQRAAISLHPDSPRQDRPCCVVLLDPDERPRDGGAVSVPRADARRDLAGKFE